MAKKVYYNNLQYIVKEKVTVRHYSNIVNYFYEQLYMYVIHDNTDDNSFIYFTANKNLEPNTKIDIFSFDFVQIDRSKSLKFKKQKTQFGDIYFTLDQNEFDIEVDFSDLTKRNKNAFFKKFQLNSDKICVDNPNWYINVIKNIKCSSYKKKILKDLLVGNQYNNEIIEHSISTMFKLKNPEFMMLNDHFIVLDQGKTGKSSMIGYFGEKLDNVSVAGLYGSSDSKNGKFVGGLVTTTNKSILIDEINELIVDKKGERILSVLNSLLENGQYNYRKQFGQVIESSNQFAFLGNISEKFSFSIFLYGTFGNTETIGRRIGIITYNDKLNGFSKGKIRKMKHSLLLQSISILLTNIFNCIISNPKYLKKLTKHKDYKRLEKWYYDKLTKIEDKINDPIAKQFVKSHKESIDRACTRGLKSYIFENIDTYISDEFKFSGKIIYESLQITEKILQRNVLNIKNIQTHMNECIIKNREAHFNLISFGKITKGERNFLHFIHINKDIIDQKGVDIETLEGRTLIKYSIKNFKLRGINKSFKNTLFEYGCNIEIRNNVFYVRFINKVLFLQKIVGVT